MFVGLHHHFLVNVITMYSLFKKKDQKNPTTYSMMYVCKYELFESERSFERKESFVILDVGRAQQCSVRSVTCNGGKCLVLFALFVPT